MTLSKPLWPALTALSFALSGCTAIIDGGQAGGSAGPGPGSGPGGPGVGTGGSVSGAAGSTGWVPGAPQPSVVVATPRLARLSRIQWQNAVRDLLYLTDISDIADKVTGDALVGLDNEAEALRVGETLRADLEKAAQALAERVTQDPIGLARLLPADAPVDEAGRARSFVTGFGLRAYRRPLSDAEVESYLALYAQGPTLYPGGDAFAAGARLLIEAVLQSPHFLYRTELSTTVAAADSRIPLSDYEVAAKLALALTNSIPDETLLAAAAAGKLRTPEAVSEQAQRLLVAESGAGGRDHLHFQLYRLGAYDGIVRNPASFPEFTPETPAAMRQEVLDFLRYVFDQGKGVGGIFTTPVGFVSAPLAPIYGLAGTYTATPTRVDLDPTIRAGLLTLPGFLSSYAVVDDPDSIHRGVFINQRILCHALPPPDPNATTLVPLDAGMTNRERVEASTGPGTCGAGCHSTVINPPGFAFEHFDAVGKYRETDRGKPINAAAAYAFDDGVKEFDGAVEFSQLLAGSSQAHACYIQDWMSYVNGHPPTEEELPLVEYLTHESLNGTLSIKDLIVKLTTSDGFLNRLP